MVISVISVVIPVISVNRLTPKYYYLSKYICPCKLSSLSIFSLPNHLCYKSNLIKVLLAFLMPDNRKRQLAAVSAKTEYTFTVTFSVWHCSPTSAATSAFKYVFVLASSKRAFTFNVLVPFLSTTGTVRNAMKSGLYSVPEVSRSGDVLSKSWCPSLVSSTKFGLVLLRNYDFGSVKSDLWVLWLCNNLWWSSLHPFKPHGRLLWHDFPLFLSPKYRKHSWNLLVTSQRSGTVYWQNSGQFQIRCWLPHTWHDELGILWQSFTSPK